MKLNAACVALLLMGVPPAVAAQERDTTSACCRVVRLDLANGQFVARETATGYTFRFAARHRRIRALKIGDAVWADFAAKTVRLNPTDKQPCCVIVDPPQTNADHPDPRKPPES